MNKDVKHIMKKLPLEQGTKVVSLDSELNLFALDKPVGIKSHPNKPDIDRKSILLSPYSLKEECYSCEIPSVGTLKVHLLNRLDSPTSGVLLLCIDYEVAKIIRELFKTRKVHKTYYSIVKGFVKQKKALWENRLSSAKHGQTLRTQKGGELLAKTNIELISYNKSLDVSLIKLTPLTGFTHQLRVQCALHGHPILGDKTYGDFAFNRKIKKITSSNRLYLHSFEIDFSYQLNQKAHTFHGQAPLPKNFENIMQFILI